MNPQQNPDEHIDFALATLLLDIHSKVGRIEEKVDGLRTEVIDHETRIRSTEKWRWGIPGAGLLAALSVLFGGGFPGHS